MKMKKIVCVMLAVFLLALGVGCVSGADPISSVVITLSAPTTGGDADAKTETNGVDLDTSWYPAQTGNTFDADKAYTATITIDNKSGYTFANSITVKLNNVVKQATKNSDGSYTITQTFNKTAAAEPITAIKLSMARPAYEGTPATEKGVTITSPASGRLDITKVTWSPSPSKFELGGVYKVTIVVTSTNSKLYPISSTAEATINGVEAEMTGSGATATITYTFPAAAAKGTTTSVNFDVTAPTVGQSPSSAKITKNSASDKTSASISWIPTSTFQSNNIYTAKIELKAKEGYVIDKNLAATVNGMHAEVVWKNNDEATVTCIFNPVSKIDVNFVAPVSGETATATALGVTTSPSGMASTATITEWSPKLVDGKFESGKEYAAKIVIPMTGNIIYDKGTMVTVNGEVATVTDVSASAKTITVTYTFPKTSFIPNPIEVIKEFFNLMKFMFNPANYFFS